MSLRCTGRLLKKLRVQPEAVLPAPTSRLGDWYANVLNIGRHRLVLATSELSLLSVVVPIKDAPRLRERIQDAAFHLLLRIGVPDVLAADEVEGMHEMPIGKTASRSVLGSMNDFATSADHYFRSDASVVYLSELELFLAETPCGPLEYRYPAEQARQALGVAQRGMPTGATIRSK